MTEAGWTRNAPTKEGWYWWRNLLTDNAPEVWAIVDHGDGLEVIGPFDETALDEWVSDMGGEWLGPITPDSYHQGRVAGLTRGAQLVRWHKSCAFEADPALALERAAKDIESVASQIIQLT
jgi:hypothetical protein